MDIANYPSAWLLELYEKMLTIREFELRAINERRTGLIPGFIHSCVGQEATAAGACRGLAAGRCDHQHTPRARTSGRKRRCPEVHDG